MKSDAPLYFRLYVIPPPSPLNWSSPRALLRCTLVNHLIQDKAPIGHLYVEFETPTPNAYGVRKVLTGMSRRSANRSSIRVAKDQVGLGTFFYDFEGKLDLVQDALQENEWALARQRLRVLKVQILPEQAQHMMSELENWIRYGAFRHYGGGHRLLRGEGAGCAEFGMHFLSIALGLSVSEQNIFSNWYRAVYAPKDLVGRPLQQQRVSLLKVYRRGQFWAKDEADGFLYRTPDPELIFNWMGERMGAENVARGQVEWELKREAVVGADITGVNTPLVSLPKIDFAAGYSVESDTTIAKEFARVKLA
jgi:hypothetical protein